MRKHILTPRKTWLCFACNHDIKPSEKEQMFRTCLKYPLPVPGRHAIRFPRDMHIDCVSHANICCKGAIGEVKKALRLAGIENRLLFDYKEI